MKKHSYKKLFNVAITTTLAAGAVVAVAPQTEAAINFKDVKETNTHYANIMNLAERGIIKGYEDGTFRPGDSIKRGNAAHIIAEIIGLDTTNVKNPNFKDISTKNSNYGAIAALANAGIINGFEDGTYRANDQLTRGQMAKIIANAFKLTSNGEALPFTDVQNSQYKENIAALYSNNVTTGVTATLFDAKSNVTRGQLSSFVVRAEKAAATPAPNPGTPTVEEGVFTVGSVVGNTVKIGGEDFEVSSELAAVFNSENAAALQDSVVTLVVEYTPETVASTTPMFAKGKGKIVGIKTLKLVKDNTSFNPKGFKIPKIEAAAKSLTLVNVKADNLEIAAGSTVTISGADIDKLVVANDAVVTLNNAAVSTLEVKGDGKITIGEGTTLTTVVLEKGKTLADVITNYEAVKAQLENVKVVEADGSVVTPPVTPPTGGGGGSTPPTTPTENQQYINTLNEKLNAINVPGVTISSSGTNVTLTTSSSINKDQLENVSGTVVNSFMGIGTTAVLNSVTINDKPYTSEDYPSTSLKSIAANLAFALGIDPGEAIEVSEQSSTASIWDKLSKSTYQGTITLNFKDGSSTPVTITLVEGQ